MPICTLMGERKRPADGKCPGRSGETARCELTNRWVILRIRGWRGFDFACRKPRLATSDAFGKAQVERRQVRMLKRRAERLFGVTMPLEILIRLVELLRLLLRNTPQLLPHLRYTVRMIVLD